MTNLEIYRESCALDLEVEGQLWACSCLRLHSFPLEIKAAAEMAWKARRSALALLSHYGTQEDRS